MNVRKPRAHQCGLTNVDFRTKGDTASVDRYNPSLKYTDMGTMSKTKFKEALPNDADLKEKWKTQGGWLPMKKADPITDDAAAYYNEQKKQLKRSVNVATTHDELQPEKWTDHVFTGDNVNTTARDAQAAGKRNEQLQKRAIGQAETEDEVTKSVEKEVTLENLVDPIAVKDIRNALRRKYASRSNLDRIFKQWDKNGSGALSAEEICHGLYKIGVRCSLEEAMALKSSVGTGELNQNQFNDLVFSKDESMSMPLNSIKAPSQEEKAKAYEQMERFSEPKCIDLEKMKESGHLDAYRNQQRWRDLLKKQANDICHELKMNDLAQTQLVEPGQLLKVINRRVAVPTILRDHHDLLH